jgi:peptidyl-prolyl cis-trans isomerase B (cyclophilin B)
MARRAIPNVAAMSGASVRRVLLVGLALLVGATSALQMNVASHVKDCSSSECTPIRQQRHPPMAFSRRSLLGSAVVTAAAAAASFGLPNAAAAAYIDPNTAPLAVTKRAYLDVQIGDGASGMSQGRIVIGLYGEVLPKAAENFAKLAESNSYADTLFYRVISDRSIQGGAIGDPVKGRSGKSAFDGGEPFVPDSFNIQHTKAGLVSAVRTADGKADSRFFVQTSDDGGWADDRYAAFGIVEEGMDLVLKIEKLDVQPPQNGPKVPVKIVKSGVL